MVSREKDFIMEYRVPILAGSGKAVLFGPEIPEVVIDPVTNRRTATVKTRCKAVWVEVTVRDAGTGKYTVDGHHYDVFRSLMARYVFNSFKITQLFFQRKFDCSISSHRYVWQSRYRS